MRRSRAGLAATAMILVALAGGCGSAPPSGAGGSPEPVTVGDIPDDQVYVPYTPPQGGYTVKVPEGWTSADRSGGAGFTDKLNTIVIESRPAPAAPDEAAARTDLDGLKTQRGFAGGKVSTVTRKAGPAVLTTYQIDAPADPVTGKILNDDVERYQFFHSGLLVTLTLSGPHGTDNISSWRTVTDSLAWTP